MILKFEQFDVSLPPIYPMAYPNGTIPKPTYMVDNFYPAFRCVYNETASPGQDTNYFNFWLKFTARDFKPRTIADITFVNENGTKTVILTTQFSYRMYRNGSYVYAIHFKCIKFPPLTCGLYQIKISTQYGGFITEQFVSQWMRIYSTDTLYNIAYNGTYGNIPPNSDLTTFAIPKTNISILEDSDDEVVRKDNGDGTSELIYAVTHTVLKITMNTDEYFLKHLQDLTVCNRYVMQPFVLQTISNLYKYEVSSITYINKHDIELSFKIYLEKREYLPSSVNTWTLASMGKVLASENTIIAIDNETKLTT